MADTPIRSFGNGTLNPAAGNDRRKKLLSLLMQRAGLDHTGANSTVARSGAASSTPFGGIRATPRNRDATGQGFTHAAQVAAQFIGGLGVGARPGSDQGGSNGQAVQRFLPSGGGPVQRRVSAPESPQAPTLDAASTDAAPDAGVAPDAGPVDAAPSAADLAPAPGDIPTADYYNSLPAFDPNAMTAAGNPAMQAPAGSWGAANNVPVDAAVFASPTPTSGSSNLIPLGNGAYFDPATGQVHFAGSSSYAV
jgi:hypothetical protein